MRPKRSCGSRDLAHLFSFYCSPTRLNWYQLSELSRQIDGPLYIQSSTTSLLTTEREREKNASPPPYFILVPIEISHLSKDISWIFYVLRTDGKEQCSTRTKNDVCVISSCRNLPRSSYEWCDQRWARGKCGKWLLEHPGSPAGRVDPPSNPPKKKTISTIKRVLLFDKGLCFVLYKRFTPSTLFNPAGGSRDRRHPQAPAGRARVPC